MRSGPMRHEKWAQKDWKASLQSCHMLASMPELQLIKSSKHPDPFRQYLDTKWGNDRYRSRIGFHPCAKFLGNGRCAVLHLAAKSLPQLHIQASGPRSPYHE